MMVESAEAEKREYSRLQNVVSSIETQLAFATPGTHPVLENFLHNARRQMDFLSTRIKEAEIERQNQDSRQLAAEILAEKETALSESEKRTYSGFLAEKFFTKGDFNNLERFYGTSWNRLSEDGKEEMSHRVWEGIRHDEYKFTDLPQLVQEKEAKRVYFKLTGTSINQSTLAQIPENDRNDFINAYDAGRHRQAADVLNRDSFRRNVSVDNSTGIRHKTADLDGIAADDKGLVDSSKGRQPSPAQQAAAPLSPGSMVDLPTDSLNLSGVKLVDVSAPTVAAIPGTSGPRLNTR